MAAATAPLFPVHPRSASEEQRVLLSDVPWSVYVTLRDAEVDLARIAHFAAHEGQHAALRAFRAELRRE